MTRSLINAIALTVGLQLVVLVGLVASANAAADHNNNNNMAFLDSPILKFISDEDQVAMQTIKYHIAEEFAKFKTINEVHSFLDKIKLLVQKHPKNVAFAHGDLRELHKFLSQEIITKLIRVDTDPFVLPIGDEKVNLVRRAIDEDELVRKLFSVPFESMIEARRAQVTRAEDGNHKDGNFFANFWCRISGGCSN